MAGGEIKTLHENCCSLRVKIILTWLWKRAIFMLKSFRAFWETWEVACAYLHKNLKCVVIDFQFQSETRRYQIPPPLFIALKITEKTLSDFCFFVWVLSDFCGNKTTIIWMILIYRITSSSFGSYVRPCYHLKESVLNCHILKNNYKIWYLKINLNLKNNILRINSIMLQKKYKFCQDNFIGSFLYFRSKLFLKFFICR